MADCRPRIWNLTHNLRLEAKQKTRTSTPSGLNSVHRLHSARRYLARIHGGLELKARGALAGRVSRRPGRIGLGTDASDAIGPDCVTGKIICIERERERMLPGGIQPGVSALIQVVRRSRGFLRRGL